jgi:hypothetical protein
MGRKAHLDICRKCGGQARRINYISRSKGKTYRYLKFVHSNGIVHYWRIAGDSAAPPSPQVEGTVFDAIQDIFETRMQGKELRFGEIKSLLEESYGRTVGTATIYRNIGKLLKLDLIGSRTEGRAVLFSRKFGSPSLHEVRLPAMTISFNYTKPVPSVTAFAHVKNYGIGLVARYMIYLPFGPIDSLEPLKMTVFNETNEIPLGRESISYSSYGQTVLSIGLDKPLHKWDDTRLFWTYSYPFADPVKMMLPSNVDILRVNCEVVKGKDAIIKKKLLDGLKEMAPSSIKRIRTASGHTIVEAEFTDASRGDTIIVSPAK